MKKNFQVYENMANEIIELHQKWFPEPYCHPTGMLPCVPLYIHISIHESPTLLLLHLTLLFDWKPNNALEPLWPILGLTDMKHISCSFLVCSSFACHLPQIYKEIESCILNKTVKWKIIPDSHHTSNLVPKLKKIKENKQANNNGTKDKQSQSRKTIINGTKSMT